MLSLALGLLLLRPQGGYPEQHARIQEQVERRYSEYAKACLRHDLYEMMNYMTSDVVWVVKKGEKKEELDRVALVGRLGEWVKSLDKDGVLRFHVNRMRIEDDDHVQTEVEVQYGPKNAPFPPKLPQDQKNIWKEDLVKVSGRWMLKRGEQISPK